MVWNYYWSRLYVQNQLNTTSGVLGSTSWSAQATLCIILWTVLLSVLPVFNLPNLELLWHAWHSARSFFTAFSFWWPSHFLVSFPSPFVQYDHTILELYFLVAYHLRSNMQFLPFLSLFFITWRCLTQPFQLSIIYRPFTQWPHFTSI